MFNHQNITKKSNPLISDPISCYREVCSQQNHNAFEVFYNFIATVRPSTILEIGTGMGGFTAALQSFANELYIPTKIRTYDVLPPRYQQTLVNLGVDVRIEDAFTDPVTNKQYTTYVDPEVISFIKQEGVTLVICDGKSKINEFRILSEHLKVGDFILAHDYYENMEVFDKKMKYNIWNWNEICMEEILEPIQKNNLVEYKKDTFNNVAWICAKKNDDGPVDELRTQFLELYEPLSSGVTTALGSDKGTTHAFMDYYYINEFSPIKEKHINLLEIGVDSGKSLVLWNQWFTNGKIFGLDINDLRFPIDTPNIIFTKADAYRTETASMFEDNFFDYIIDDGPHSLESFLSVIPLYFSKLCVGGKLVIEDISNIEWIPQLEELASKFDCTYKTIDLRKKKNRYDDILFEITKRS